MARAKSIAPSRRYHITGQSVTTIDGKDYYLGPHDSAEAIARYAMLMAVYQSNQLRLPDDFDMRSLDDRVRAMLGATLPAIAVAVQAKQPRSMKEVTAAYLAMAQDKYRDNHAELERSKQVCKELDKHYAKTLANDFGPRALQDQRERWIAFGYARVYVNRLTNFVIRIFRHAESRQMVDKGHREWLRTVEPLREGQTTAPETEAVKPVPIDDVRKTLAELSPIIRAMVRVHVATGMRPSELCNMRPMDIDRSGTVWMYRPPDHKNRKKGKARAIPIIGDAREDYMNRPADSHLFSPRESMAWMYATRAAKRKTKEGQGNAPGTNRKEIPAKQAGTKYTPTSYRQAIDRAAKRAGVPHWHPYQIRHTTLTHVRDSDTAESSQALGGHSRLSMTEHYAKQTERAAIEAAKHAPKL